MILEAKMFDTSSSSSRKTFTFSGFALLLSLSYENHSLLSFEDLSEVLK
jgi:hypothetical protein